MKKYIIFSFLLVGLLSYNLLNLHSLTLGLFFSIIYILYFGRRLGILALPQLDGFWQRLFGPLLLLAFFSLIGALIFYFYQLNNQVIIFLIALLPAVIIPFARYVKKDINDWSSGLMEPVPLVEPKASSSNFWGWLVFFGDIYLISYLVNYATEAAIRSPWTLLSYKFFLAFFILSFILFWYLKKTSDSVRSLSIVFIHSLLLIFVALIIYKIGFGFDPTLHRASENYIYQTGTLEPKTPYYLGQYTVVVLLAKISGLSLGVVDKWLLIILEAVFLAPLFFFILRHAFNLERKTARLGSLLIFLFPFTHFIATTPQDLANFYALAAICFSLLYLSTKLLRGIVPLLLVLATLATHPLTGLPLSIIFIIILLLKARQKHKSPTIKISAEIIILIITLVSFFLLPAIFVKFQGASFNKPMGYELWQFLKPTLPQFISISHRWLFLPVYLYQNFLPYIIFLLALGGTIYFYFKNKNYTVPLFLFLAFLIFGANAFFLKTSVIFKDLGNAEQGQYAERLSHFSFYLLLPLAIYAFFAILGKIEKKLKSQTALSLFNLFSAGFLAILLTFSFYLSYPRVDAYALSHYINTSRSDLKAVQEIDQKSAGEPYLVLANLSVSAAGIEKYGYKKYFTTPTGEQIFYYSLPTGGSLYHYFEDMVYQEPSVETMIKAMNLTGVNQSYLVLNDYWDSFNKVLPAAKLTADEWWQVDNGKIFVFKYKRKIP